jgi:hypothetical protein
MRSLFGEKQMTVRAIVMGMLCVGLGGCAESPPPQPVAPIAADNGQPKMQAAWNALQNARVAVETAGPNKGGHREAALQLIAEAMSAVQAGMQYAAQHPTEAGLAEGAAYPEPVNEEVVGAERQPHMRNGIVQLREARRQLTEAKHDKGGYRAHALSLVNQAIVQLREGINFANTH